jgi:hypothetical protein
MCLPVKFLHGAASSNASSKLDVMWTASCAETCKGVDYGNEFSLLVARAVMNSQNVCLVPRLPLRADTID